MNTMNKPLSILIRLLSIAVQLIYVKSYTHYLTSTELGYSFYLTALSYAINALILVPADFYQQACLALHRETLFPLGSVIALNKRLVLTAAALTVLLGLPIWLSGKLSILDIGLIFSLALFLYFSTSSRNYLNNRGHGLFTGWMLLVEAVIKTSSFFIFIFLGMSHISAFVLSTVTAFLIESICLAFFFYRIVPFTFLETGALSFNSMIATSSSVSFCAVCNWLQLQGYRIVYVWLGYAQIAGLYAAVSNLGIMGMNASSAVFSQTFLPKVYSSGGAFIVQYLRYALFLCAGVLIGYLAFGNILLTALTKKEFKPYAGLMLFGILIESGNLLIGAASTYFTIRQKPFKLIAANISGLLAAGVGIAACLIWYPRNYYLLGAVLVCSQGAVCTTLFFEGKADLPRKEIHA